MKIQFKTTIICVICVSVLFTTGAIAKELSVLERAVTVDDRELGELIRIAIENLPETNALKRASGGGHGLSSEEYGKLKYELQGAEETARAKVIRSVTEVYAQIILLDTQIDQARIKMDSLSKSEAIYTELTLAIAELQAKRSTQLAQLRQIMNIVPKYAFGHKPANTLNGWLVLDVIGDEVYVFKALRPFRESDSITGNPRYTRSSDTEIIKEMSKKEAVEYIKNYIKDKNKHPFRIDITKNTAGTKLSKELYDDIVRMIKAEKLELESVVYLHGGVHDMFYSTYYFIGGKIYYRYGRSHRDLYSGSEQEYIDGCVSEFKDPKYLPCKYILEFDEESEELANHIKDAILLKAKEFKVEKLVEFETRKVLWVDIYEYDNHQMKSIYFNPEDYMAKKNGVSYDSFVNDILPDQLKKYKGVPIKYFFHTPGARAYKNQIQAAIRMAAKEASVEDMVEIE